MREVEKTLLNQVEPSQKELLKECQDAMQRLMWHVAKKKTTASTFNDLKAAEECITKIKNAICEQTNH